MLTITKKKFEEYEQFLWEKDNGRLFVLDKGVLNSDAWHPELVDEIAKFLKNKK